MESSICERLCYFFILQLWVTIQRYSRSSRLFTIVNNHLLKKKAPSNQKERSLVSNPLTAGTFSTDNKKRNLREKVREFCLRELLFCFTEIASLFNFCFRILISSYNLNVSDYISLKV